MPQQIPVSVIARAKGQDLKGHGTSSNTQPVTNPALEKPLLKLHRAIDVRSFWKAVHQLLSASIPNHSVGSSLQQGPVVPLISRWTLRIPKDFFVAEPLRSYAMGPATKKIGAPG